MYVLMTNSLLDDDEDLGLVNINDFCQLQSCFDNLSKSHANLNQNVIMLMELIITNLIKMQSLEHVGNPSVVPPLHLSPVHAFAHAISMHDIHKIFVEDEKKGEGESERSCTPDKRVNLLLLYHK